MSNSPLLIFSTIAIFLAAGCVGQRPEVAPWAAVEPTTVTRLSLDSSLRTIQSVAPHLADMDAEFRDLPRPRVLGRSYFNATEVDAIEGVLFRFLAIQTALWDLVGSYGGLHAQFVSDDLGTKANVLSITATLLMAGHTAFVVAQFADDPIAIKQLNEAYPRSEISFGTYDRMRNNVTSPDLLEAVAETKKLYAKETADPQSPLSLLTKSDTVYADLIKQIPARQDEAEVRLQQVAKLFPSHSKVEKLARKDAERQHKVLYKIRSALFKDVSRLKDPFAHVITFSDKQKNEIFSLIKPGDLILTYTAGYMSDVFIPGAFKHGITYIGTPDDRKGLNLSPGDLPPNNRFEPQRLSANLKRSSLSNGQRADMIEAVAEGVIFNSLEHIMDTHINRMIILRPRLSDVERAAFLVEVYSYLGEEYDFRFDFADASRQVCTEVIYRALDGKGSINFELTVRAGHETLSADDIVNYHVAPNSQAFDFVLLVEADPQGKKNEAMIVLGPNGERRLESLMKEIK